MYKPSHFNIWRKNGATIYLSITSNSIYAKFNKFEGVGGIGCETFRPLINLPSFKSLSEKEKFNDVINELKACYDLNPNNLKKLKKDLRMYELHTRRKNSFDYLFNLEKREPGISDEVAKLIADNIKRWAHEVFSRVQKEKHFDYPDSYRIAEAGNKRSWCKFMRDRTCCGSYEEVFTCPFNEKKYWLGFNYGH